ncbi:MAG: electron transport complex subunit RsxC [Bacilli bacterium]|nr:electron transport complex subunit RsxC [Bacilli bacterium]
MNGVRLPKRKKLSTNKNIYVYNKPKTVYIPLISSNDENITILVKKDDYVFKGSVVGRRKGNYKMPIHSSVSGRVMGFEEHTYLHGEKVKCVVIENDFKEKMENRVTPRTAINKFTKEEFVEKLLNHGVIGQGGGGFPTYAKFNSDKKITTLIINAVECEPYITADFMLFKEKCEEILEAIDAIVEINNIDEAIIATKKSNYTLNKLLMNFLGTYLKIKLLNVPNLYPMGWERALIKEVTGVEYDKLPIEKGIVVINSSTAHSIYEALKLDKPVIERVVTFTGEMLKEPQNVLVKVGTPVSEVIESIGGYKRNKEIVFVAGGPMMGTALPTDDLVVSPNMNCILVLKEIKTVTRTECLRCGKCVKVCPVKLSPVLIRDSLNNIDDLDSYNADRCIECGLCSYICPAKINIRQAVKIGKKKLSERG